MIRQRVLPGKQPEPFLKSIPRQFRERRPLPPGTSRKAPGRPQRLIFGLALLLALLLGPGAARNVHAGEGDLPAVITAGGDRSIKRWDNKGTLVSTIGTHEDTITAILIAPGS